jgi:methionyl-tRNA synthetase
MSICELSCSYPQMNKYMERTAPWSMASSPDRSVQEACQEVIFLAAEGLRITGILLQPFLPAKAGQLLDMLGVRQDWRTFEHAALRADPEYGRPFVSPGQSRVDALFPPLVEETDFKVGEKVGHNRDRIRRKKEKVEEEEKERLLGKKEEEVTTEGKTEEVKKEEGSV